MNAAAQHDPQALATIAPMSPAPVSLGTLTAATPAALVAGASEMARTLAEVIRSQHLSTRIQGRDYVQVEGWTTLATMLGVTAREVTTTENDGIYTAVVELVRLSDGAIVSRASAECGSPDELDRYGKPLWAKRARYARRSMAQTRATGKACRLAFSWVMRLAGYEPTPAEEMPNEHEQAASHPAISSGSAPPAQRNGAPISAAQKRRLEARIGELGLDRERVKAWLSRAWKVEHFQDLPAARYTELDQRLDLWGQAEQEAREEREAIQAE